MQNSMFLAVLRLISALKTEIAPPKIVRWEVEVGVSAHEDLFFCFEITWFWREKRSEFRWRPFFFFFFWRSLDFREINALNFGDDLFFFWRSLDFGQKNALNLPQSNSRQMKIRVKFVYGWIKLQKKPPPLEKSWLRDWCQLTHVMLYRWLLFGYYWGQDTLVQYAAWWP